MHGDTTTWIQTYSGQMFWPLDPRPEDITIGDIAHALSLKCRFSGHCVEYYSVAQHSVLGSYHVHKDNALWFLLHDAAEAYLFDAARPIKASRPWIREDEARLMNCVCLRFGLPLVMPAEVKLVDTRMLLTEARDLMTNPPRPWDNLGTEAYPDKVITWSWQKAKTRFLSRFNELTSKS